MNLGWGVGYNSAHNTPLSALGGFQGMVSHHLLGSDELGNFHTTPLKIELVQNCLVLYFYTASLESAHQAHFVLMSSFLG